MRKKDSKRTPKRRVDKRKGEPTQYFERGREVLDLIAVERNCQRAARQVLALLDSEIIPLFLRESVEEAIQEAARRRVKIDNLTVVRRSATGEYLGAEKHPAVAKNLRNLFEVTDGVFTLRLSEREKLAKAISEILNNKLTPVPLYNSVGDFTTEITRLLLDNGPEVIEKALAKSESVFVSAAKAEVQDEEEE